MIESKATRRFWRAFEALPVPVQREAKQAYRLFLQNPAHPSLHFKKLGEDPIYSVRINIGYRALGAMKNNRIIWFWIGGHDEYDRLI